MQAVATVAAHRAIQFPGLFTRSADKIQPIQRNVQRSYANEIRAFCDSVLENRPPARAGLGDTHAMMRLYEAFKEPAGKTIDLGAPAAV